VRIIWTRAAARDLDLITEYIREDDPAAALRTKSAIVRQVDLLQNLPSIGRPGRIAGTRELVIARLPYLVVYTQDRRVIRILRVLHGAMNWPPRS